MLFCQIDVDDEWVLTRFGDGTEYGAHAHDTPEYRALAARCGYDSIHRYAVEHEIAHNLVGEIVFRGPSRVIWGCAHERFAPMAEILAEEALSLELQAFARADVLPGSSAPGFDWFKVRDRFLRLIAGAHTTHHRAAAA